MSSYWRDNPIRDYFTNDLLWDLDGIENTRGNIESYQLGPLKDYPSLMGMMPDPGPMVYMPDKYPEEGILHLLVSSPVIRLCIEYEYGGRVLFDEVSDLNGRPRSMPKTRLSYSPDKDFITGHILHESLVPDSIMNQRHALTGNLDPLVVEEFPLLSQRLLTEYQSTGYATVDYDKTDPEVRKMFDNIHYYLLSYHGIDEFRDIKGTGRVIMYPHGSASGIDNVTFLYRFVSLTGYRGPELMDYTLYLQEPDSFDLSDPFHKENVRSYLGTYFGYPSSPDVGYLNGRDLGR